MSMENLPTTHSIICHMTAGEGVQQVRYSCEDMVAVDRIIEETYALERYIDAQAGGPGQGWFRIVLTPAEAREVIAGGKILAIGRGGDVQVPEGAKVVDCRGKTITAGLIDASFVAGLNNQDSNEQSKEVTPHMRILDSLDPEDPLFRRARRNGVTTAHVMPRTQNVIGGLGCVIKTFGDDPDSMLVKQDASMRIVMAQVCQPLAEIRPKCVFAAASSLRWKGWGSNFSAKSRTASASTS